MLLKGKAREFQSTLLEDRGAYPSKVIGGLIGFDYPLMDLAEDSVENSS